MTTHALGDKEHAVYVLDAQGRRRTDFALPQSAEGLGELVSRLRPFEPIEGIAIEREGEASGESARIRSLLEDGRVREATAALGYTYTVTGEVIGGDLSIMPPVGMLADVAPTLTDLLGLPPADARRWDPRAPTEEE
mgnify:CR=1 FL=1